MENFKLGPLTITGTIVGSFLLFFGIGWYMNKDKNIAAAPTGDSAGKPDLNDGQIGKPTNPNPASETANSNFAGPKGYANANGVPKNIVVSGSNYSNANGVPKTINVG